jgi:predicted DNA binding protein
MPSGVSISNPDDCSDSLYDIDAEAHFSGDGLVMCPTLRASPRALFRLDYHATSRPQADELYVTSTGLTREAMAELLDADDTVADAAAVVAFEAESVFRVRPTAGALRLLPLVESVGGYVRSVRGQDEGWTVRMHLPNRSSLVTLNEIAGEEGLQVSVSHLSDLDSTTRNDVPALTAEQRELLLVANEHGYFETPRRISQRELAEEFGVSPSAVSQRLRGAIGNLVDYMLGGA